MVKISPMGRIFKFIVLRLLENVLERQKMNPFIHLLMPQSKLLPDSYYHTHTEKDITHFPRQLFENRGTFFPTKKAGREIYELKKSSKLICVGIGHKF